MYNLYMLAGCGDIVHVVYTKQNDEQKKCLSMKRNALIGMIGAEYDYIRKDINHFLLIRISSVDELQSSAESLALAKAASYANEKILRKHIAKRYSYEMSQYIFDNEDLEESIHNQPDSVNKLTTGIIVQNKKLIKKLQDKINDLI